MMQLQRIQIHLQSVAVRIVQNTFKSSSKYIRILLVTSSLFTVWSILRWIYLNVRNKIFNYPPLQYPGFPILGSLPYMINIPYFLHKIGKYPICSTRMGRDNVVWISDMNLFEHKSKIFNDLTDRNPVDLCGDDINPFLLLSGHKWLNRRKIGMNAFLNQLDSKYLNDGFIDILNKYIFPEIDKCHNKIYNTAREDMLYSVFTMIFSTSFGHTVDVPTRNDQMVKKFLAANEIAVYSIHLFIVTAMLFGIKIANYLHHYILNITQPVHDIEHVITSWIEQYEHNDDKNNDAKNYYIDDMLKHIENNGITRMEMIRDTASLFVAAIDTTTGTLEQGIFFLAKYQSMQQRIYNELNEYKTKYGKFSLDHLDELHILRSFVFEVLRNIRHSLQFSFPRYVTLDDAMIAGYNIPKGWYVMANHWAVRHNNKYWQKPDEFYIDRFLDSNKKFKMNKNMIAFGVGKRGCPGKSLAIKTLNVLFAHLILRYELLPNDENTFSSLNHLPGGLITVKSVPIIVKVRNNKQ